MSIGTGDPREIAPPAACGSPFSRGALPGLALVDYDNLRGLRRASQSDFELHSREVVDEVICVFRRMFADIRELDVRFYGGWTDESGLPSRDHMRLLHALPSLRGRHQGLIVRPALATAMLQFPGLILRGTVRHEVTKPSAKTRTRQKMVDGMLGCDAIFATTAGIAHVAVVTDDDDLVPSVLVANTSDSNLTTWVRRRKTGTGLNDRSLIDRGIRFRQIEGPNA